jgi:EAL domain-containing protein (putative c-di-GMP-specific phosphodiesterase class I)
MLNFPDEILRDGTLCAIFQPIFASGTLDVLGYEGLIRGPAGSALEPASALFACARTHHRQLELELCCLRTIWSRFRALGLPGKLFINVSPGLFLAPKHHQRAQLARLADLEIDTRRIVIEITEEQAVTDLRRLRRMARYWHQQGCAIAIDDLGAGFASLRLWLELRPCFVKVDMAFIQGIERDAVKRAFLRSIQHIAHTCGSRVIAEGIETAAELDVVRTLGVACSQGYHLARPSPSPIITSCNKCSTAKWMYSKF